VDGLAAREDLSGAGLTAQASREIKRPTPVAALDRHRLAGVDPDADAEREIGIGDGLVGEALLQLDGRSDRLTCRPEDGERLVAAELQEGPAPLFDPLASDVGEPLGEPPSGLVAVLLGEQCVAADVRDQERPDLGPVATALVRAARHRPPSRSRIQSGEYRPRAGCALPTRSIAVRAPGWRESGHWEATCVCGNQHHHEGRELARRRLDPLDPTTARHFPQCEFASETDPAVIRVLLKVKPGLGEGYDWIMCGACEAEWQVMHYAEGVG